jgi:hypothetical protein
MKVIKIKLEEARDTTSEAAFLEALRVAGLEGEIDVSPCDAHGTRNGQFDLSAQTHGCDFPSQRR